MPRALLAVALLVLPALAGCLQNAPGSEVDTARAAGGLLPDLPTFSPLKLLDEVRAGGEPVIAITPTGTILVSSHPGWTHTRYPPSPNLVTPASGQSYLWRSTDGGETFTPIGLPMLGVGPRGVGQGVSDPDFAIDSNGRIYLTDLEALAAASVSWSDDDGATWLMGNNVASTYGPIDRQWLATHGTDVYFTGNYFVANRVLKSTDGGLTWTEVGQSNCNGDMIVRESDGAVLKGCGNGIDVSVDGGATFEIRDVPDTQRIGGPAMTEPAIDAAGNVYTAWEDEAGVWLAGTADLGETWTTPLRVSIGGAAADKPRPDGRGGVPNGTEPGTNLWPWVVAGDAGRVAVLWLHTDTAEGMSSADSQWFVDMTIVLDAMAAAPQLAPSRLTPEPVHTGYICVGTVCQADPEPTGDRRLGDFFEAAIDAEGHVHAAFAVTSGDSISHPGYVKQLSGPRLRV